MNSKKPFIVIVGPTASGKSRLAVKLGMALGVEIISADSRQIYQGMDIGTAKPSPLDLIKVKHHMVNVIPPDQPFSVGDYKRRVEDLMVRFDQNNSCSGVILAGGTGLYIKAVLYGLWDGPPSDMELRKTLTGMEKEMKGSLYRRLTELDPVSSARIHPNDLSKIIRALEVFNLTGIPLSSFHQGHCFRELNREFLIMGLKMDREVLYQRIHQRVDEMIEKGWVNEVRRLLENGAHEELPSMRSLGYNHLCSYLKGRVSLAEAVGYIKRDTRHYAKRQMTWFNKDPNIHWMEWDGENLSKSLFNLIYQFINKKAAVRV